MVCGPGPAGSSGEVLYARQLAGESATVAVTSTGCMLQVVRADLSGKVMLRTLPLDNSSDGGVEMQVSPSAPNFVASARDGVVAIVHGGSLSLFRADGGAAIGSMPVGGTTSGAVAFSVRGSELQAWVHGNDGPNYVWTIAGTSPLRLVDAGTSPCSGILPSRAAVLSSEEQVFSAARATTGSSCTIMNRTDPTTGRSTVRAFISHDAGVLLQNYGSAAPPPKTLVGASGMVAVFGFGAFSGTDMRLTRHFLDAGFTVGTTVVDLDLANAVELLVAPNGDLYVVGTTKGGATTGGADLGGALRVPNDGGGWDPFVAKFTGNTVAWVQNFGGAANETATHAVLAGDQLVVVGTCGPDGGSALCNGAGNHWLVSLKP